MPSIKTLARELILIHAKGRFVRRPRVGGDPVSLGFNPLDSRLRGNDARFYQTNN